MTSRGSEGMEFIGAGAAASLARAATYFEQLSSQGSSPDELRVNLREDITAARAELEATLTGHDSFDALAFIRMLAGPWDLTGVHESETQVETSQAVQDVIAHAALGLGLPRQPLTGENSGQPDVGALIAAASKVVMAARTLAMLDGSQLSHPLGPLAGEFMAYELSVRGRQYTSIAEELNTELLGHAHVSPMLEQVLGFTLGHIREVRVASLALLNERFFGARDRVGDAVQSGAGVGGIDRDQFRHDINLMMNECRLYGAVSSADVAQRIGLDVGVVGAVLRFFSTSRPEADAKNPIEAFVDGEALSHGSIGDGDEFLLLNGFLAEDELRRDVERGLKAASDGARGRANVWAKYDKNRSAFSERMSADAFSSLLADEVPRWQAKKYAGPVDVADVGSLSQESDHPHIAMRIYESDALFVVDGVAICIEVKAGSVTDKARGGRANRLAKDLEKTLQEGNDQAQRLVQLIEANRGVWGDDGQWVDLSDVTEVHSVIVMLDDMGPLSLSMNELADKGIIETEDVPWIVSLHDLLVISRTSDHPAQFLEYLRRRRGRRLATMVNGADELDMFMWFVGGGMYFEPDPVEVTAQLPLDRPITAGQMRRFDRQRRVRLGTLTDPLDSWFYGREGHSSIEAPKPTRREQPWVEEFLTASETAKSPGWLRFGADLVSLSESAQAEIGKNLRAQIRKARSGGPERSLTTHGTGPAGSWLLTAAAVPEGVDVDRLVTYIDAKQYQTESSRSMLLLYDVDGSMSSSRFRGSPQPRNDERDEVVAVLPLKSLEATFRKLPPSARRATRRLRGKGGRKRRGK